MSGTRGAVVCSLSVVLAIVTTCVLGGCPPIPVNPNGECPGAGETQALPLHEDVFTHIFTEYAGTESCLVCHAEVAADIQQTEHWNWQGPTPNLVGYENEVHGKRDLINNFCIAVISNEARCTQCHIGYGWADDTFDLSEPTNIDCLVCHDRSGQYAKDLKTAGLPKPDVDLLSAAKSVGAPTRANCGACHFYAGGGDNVKHGDLSSALVDPDPSEDVHMGGLDFACQDCHRTADHQIAGTSLHATDRVECTDCHVGEFHGNAVIDLLHVDHVACQTCHIPRFSRSVPTKVEWYWSDAGQDIDPIPVDQFGMPTYDKKKGTAVWDMNVKPVYLWSNGKVKRYMLGDPYEATPVVLAEPDGDITDPAAKIYPFKRMIGDQPGDAVNKILLVPHLFGAAAGPNFYWKTFEWGPALQEGADAAGLDYSGSYEWVDTVMYLSLNHEIAPKEEALDCLDCHNGGMDFEALGYEGDPWAVGGRDLD